MAWVSFNFNILLCSEVAGCNFFGTPSKGDEFSCGVNDRSYFHPLIAKSLTKFSLEPGTSQQMILGLYPECKSLVVTMICMN